MAMFSSSKARKKTDKFIAEVLLHSQWLGRDKPINPVELQFQAVKVHVQELLNDKKEFRGLVNLFNVHYWNWKQPKLI